MILFITHAGYGGVTEATYFGKPMLAIPFFADQKKNAAEVVRKGHGILLPIDEVTEKTLEENLNNIINDQKYYENIKRVSDLFKDQPINPMDNAIFWVEHVLKYKNTNHFKTKAATLPFYKYFLLDVISFLLLSIITIIFIVKFSIKFIFKLLKCKFSSNKCNKQKTS